MRVFAVFALTVASFALATAQTNHSATYDDEHQIKLSGPVTRIDWTNPHAFIFINTRDANWAVEVGNPLDLEREGWKRSSVQIGDVVNVEGVPARGQKRQALARSVTLARTNAKVFANPNQKYLVPVGPAPRWPDGQVRLGPAPGKKGYWTAASGHNLIEHSATPILMNDDGLLKNLSDIDRVAPFQPWARAVYEYRQRSLLIDDPFVRCLPPGGPRQFQTAHGFQFIEQRELGRILVLLGGGDRNWRVIYTDGRSQGQADEVVRGYYGTSVGHWENGPGGNKDTLVVDSIGFNEHFWFANGGLPHTEHLHLTERFTRTELGRLKYEVTVDDPATYTRPWTGGWTLQWMADRDIEEYFCEENAESTFIR